MCLEQIQFCALHSACTCLCLLYPNCCFKSTTLNFDRPIFNLSVELWIETNFSFVNRYKKYVQIGKISTSPRPVTAASRNVMRSIKLLPMSDYGFDSNEKVRTPNVSRASLDIYERYVQSPEDIMSETHTWDKNAELIRRYVSMI